MIGVTMTALQAAIRWPTSSREALRREARHDARLLTDSSRVHVVRRFLTLSGRHVGPCPVRRVGPLEPSTSAAAGGACHGGVTSA